MKRRVIGAIMARALWPLGFALSVFAAVTASSPQAQAIPVQIDLTITYIPGNPIFPNLTGVATFGIPFGEGGDLVIGGFNSIGKLIPGNPIFTGRFIPLDPCVGGGTCRVDFAFGGNSGDFAAFAFQTGNVPSSQPTAVPFIPLGNFIPGNPIFIATGPIVAFDDAVQIGTWKVTIEAATPLPGALAMFSGGLGVLGLLGWRRKRKNAAATAA